MMMPLKFPKTMLARNGLMLATCLWLGGCAGPLEFFRFGDTAPLFPDKTMSVQVASDAIVVGKTTKADVLATLGKAKVVRFDSGFEVWAYRGKTPGIAGTGKTEFVILFAPTGIVQKTRVREPDGHRAARQDP